MNQLNYPRQCVFCAIVTGQAPAETVWTSARSIAIVPLNPVTSGHILVLPRRHVDDAYADGYATMTTTRDAAVWASRAATVDDRYASVNLITSVGRPATQTVRHLHVHVVPRTHGDGLHLPWTGQDT